MDPAALQLFQQLAISLALGLLVGLQRQHSESILAGVRTFPLVALLGTLCSSLDRQLTAHGWLIAAALIGLSTVVVVTNLRRSVANTTEPGLTTEIALLLMFAVGAYVVVGDRIVAIAVGAAVAVLLQFKPELHGLAARLGDEDLRAIMTFVLISCIVLPVLPDRTYDLPTPLNVLNPFQTWLMVVLMVGISLGGYLLYKFLGHTAGLLFSGLLGGAISSTATTLSYARRTRHTPAASGLSTLVIAIASTTVYVRVLIEIAIVGTRFFPRLAAPIGIMLLASVLATAAWWLRVRQSADRMPEQKNPTELRSAVLFGLLFAGVLMALAATQRYVGRQGLYPIAAISGLTDMDAITLSTARMLQVESPSERIGVTEAWRLLVIATMSNLIFKAGLVAVAGDRRLLLQIGVLFSVPFATGALLLWLWPS